jgi:CRP-like cAMP-binding protein
LLAAVSEKDRRELLAVARRRGYARGEVLCRAGDVADSLHLVARGRLAVHVSLESGDTAMINLLGPGDYFGELALLNRSGRRTATITALQDAETLVLTSAAFRRLRSANPAFEQTLSALLGHRIDELSQRLVEAVYVGLDQRLQRRLLDLALDYAERPGQTTVRIPLTQAQLADLVGGTRPSVNQALQRLVDQGIVSVSRGRVDVLDTSRLRAVRDG